MDDYLSKPLEFDKLKSILKKYLNNSFYEELRKQKLDEIAISKNLNIPIALAKELIMNFKNEINSDLDDLKKIIVSSDEEAILKKINYLKNSCLVLGLNMTINILDNMQFNLINNQEVLIKEFDKLYLTLIYSCDSSEGDL